MKKFAAVFPGQKPKTFLPQEPKALQEFNEQGCNIFIESRISEMRTYRQLVLFSDVPLDKDPVAPSAVYGSYYIYAFENIINADRYQTFKDFMLSAYPTAKEVKYYPAPGYSFDGKIYKEEDMVPIKNDTIQKYILYYGRYRTIAIEIYQHNFLLKQDVDGFEEIQKMVSVKSVLQHFEQVYKSELYYDPSIDRVVNNESYEPYWDALTYAYLACWKSVNEMKKFFNQKFWYEFSLPKGEEETQDEQDEGLGSRILYDIPGLTTKWKTYWSGDKQITDFLIRVKYMIETPDGGKKYIVDLIWDIKTTEDVEFPAVFSKSNFKQKIAYYGPYHYTGWDPEISIIHKAISDTPVPRVEPLVWFGYHGHLLAAENCVYDTESKILYEREGNYYFNREIKKGFAVIDSQGVNLAITMQGVPRFNLNTQRHSLDDYRDYFSRFYKDELGMFIFIYIVALINAGRLRRYSDLKFPFLILHGKYGWGKSSLSDMIKRVFNIADLEKGQMKYWETTPFASLYQCSYRHGLPIFITEFKEENEMRGDSKVANLCAMYDRSVVPKGQANQNVIYYNLNALAIIDGEELPRRSALKSRSVILNINSGNNGLSLDAYKTAIKESILPDLFSQVLEKDVYYQDYKMYEQEAMKYWEEVMPTAAARLKENFSALYASALLYDVALREDLKYYLKKYFIEQYEREQATYWASELLDIIKKYSKQMNQHECFWYDRTHKRFCIRVDQVASFIERHHIKLSLWFEALKVCFPTIEYVEETMGWLSECAVYPMNDLFPKQLLFDPAAYGDYKAIVKPLAPSNPI